MGGWGGCEEKWSLKLPQPSLVLVEVEAELGNIMTLVYCTGPGVTQPVLPRLTTDSRNYSGHLPVLTTVLTLYSTIW